MIAHLRGKLAQKDSARVIVDVHGVGYEVFIPLTTFTALPEPGSEVFIDIHTHVREDVIALYGFSSRRERVIFEKLMTISGIGPKLAVTILSGGSVEDLTGAIRRGDLARLTAIPGVGKKTAERMVLELKDRLKDVAPAPEAEGAQPSTGDRLRNDLISALENLGYHRPLAEKAVDASYTSDGGATFEDALRSALRELMR